MLGVLVIKKSIIYFSNPGPECTDDTLKVSKKRAEELGIKDIVVASTRGATGLKTVEVFKGYNVIVVPHMTGVKGRGIQELSDEMANKIKAGGGKVHIASPVMHALTWATWKKFNTMYPGGIIAQTLRILGEGMKVVTEITAMAADAGLIPMDKDIIAIAGSKKGADTAVVIEPANSINFFDMIIKEIIAKPSNLE